MIITVTDTIGTSGSVTVEHYDVADAIIGWYPDAPEEVTEAVNELQGALNTGSDVTGWAEYLGLQLWIEKV